MTYGLPYTPSFYFQADPRRRPVHRAIFWLFTAMPWNPLAKAILDMAVATNTRAHPGIRWGQRDSYCVSAGYGGAAAPAGVDPLETWVDTACVFPVGSCLAALAVQFAAYTLLGVWLDAVLPDALGVGRHPLFFLQRAFWRPRRDGQGAALARLVAEAEARAAAEKHAERGGGAGGAGAGGDARGGAGGRAISAAGGPDEDDDVGEESARIKRSLGQKVGGLVRVDGGGGGGHAWLPHSSGSGGDGGGGGDGAAVVTRHRSSASGVRRRSISTSGAGAGAGQRHGHQAAPPLGAGAGGDAAAAAPPEYAVEVFGLQRVFRAGWWARRAPRWLGGRPGARDFWAVKDSWFGIERGSLFCLLGPNGAGKTTTINCLTGALPPSAGDALVYGESLRGEGGLDRVRALMGVCPQFDVLWGELSGREHLTIYGHVKGLRFSEVKRQGAELLERVKLTAAGDVRSASYSGGMKRRLSVAVALLGDPKIVYLDEPTTGMDPISRRYVWDIIQEAKAGRAIVLTTHSMEEADILADRIAIMARGRLKAIGSSLRLKQKYGAGYTLAVSVLRPASGDNGSAALAARADAVRDFFAARLGLAPFDEGRTHLHYVVPRALEARLGGVLAELEGRGGGGGGDGASAAAARAASDVQVSLTSLEEVFLTIARRAELAAAEALGEATVEVPLPCGGALRVALGQERAVSAADGRVYAVKWAQDDAGRLVVLDVAPLGYAPVPGAGGGFGDAPGPCGGRISQPGGLRAAGRGGGGKHGGGGGGGGGGGFAGLLGAGLKVLRAARGADSSSHGSGDSGGGQTANGGAASAHFRHGVRASSGGGAMAAAERGEHGRIAGAARR